MVADLVVKPHAPIFVSLQNDECHQDIASTGSDTMPAVQNPRSMRHNLSLVDFQSTPQASKPGATPFVLVGRVQGNVEGKDGTIPVWFQFCLTSFGIVFYDETIGNPLRRQ